jgi:hypothetical protein
MKKIISIMAALFSLAMIYDVPPKYYDAITTSEPLMKMIAEEDVIVGIKHTGKNLNCSGCFEFEVFYKPKGLPSTKKARFYTMNNYIAGSGILVFRRD